MTPEDSFAFIDASYLHDLAVAGAVVTDSEDPRKNLKNYTSALKNPCSYEPGSFYKRELPCILKVLEKIEENVSIIFVDAYVWLPDGRPGLGARLYETLKQEKTVIGIAKNRFLTPDGAGLVKDIYRGKSKRPLFVSAAGVGLDDAAKIVLRLPGPFRIPSAMKAAHNLSKSTLLSLAKRRKGPNVIKRGH